MKKYDEYKDSGFDWIGKIPAQWDNLRLRFVCELRNGYTPSKDNSDYWEDGTIPWYRMEDIRDTGRKLQEAKQYITEEAVKGGGLFDAGSFILATTATIGEHALLIVDSLANQRFTNLKIRKSLSNILSRDYFFYYLFVIDDYCKATTKTSTFPAVSMELLKNCHIVFPSFCEQTAIATYLDTHCAKIDNLISIQQKRIALLQELKQSVITHAVTKGLNPNVEMKQSGVEWIGDVPKHWEITKMNNNCSTITDYVASGSFADLRKNVLYLDEPDYAMLIRTADLSSNDRKLPPVYISKRSYEFLSNSNLFGGEVILPNIGASIGNVYMVPKLYKHMSLAPNAIMVKSYGNDRFLYYYFKSKPGVDSLMLIGMAAAQDKFNKTELRSLKVLVPPMSEQAAIASYLDHKCATIDASISNAQHQIDLLQEYKQSLITEVVTGKYKVY